MVDKILFAKSGVWFHARTFCLAAPSIIVMLVFGEPA